MKVHLNWKLSCQGDKDNDDDGGCRDDVDNVFSCNFVDFSRSAMTIYYMYCVCTKYSLLD